MRIDNIVREKIASAIANGKVGVWNKAAYKPIGEAPSLYIELTKDLPRELVGGDAQPSAAENVIYCTMAMWGHHQHCNDVEEHPAHKAGISLGTSISMIKNESSERVLKLFTMFIDSYEYPFEWELIQPRLKRIVEHLRTAHIPTDYGMLAEQLYSVAIGESDMQEIGRSWISDYYADSYAE